MGLAVAHAPPGSVTGCEGDRSVQVAFVSLDGLSEGDRATWRELLHARSESAPFLDEDWVAAWSQAFGPREPLLVCGWEGSRLVGLGALQSLSESWAGCRIAVIFPSPAPGC